MYHEVYHIYTNMVLPHKLSKRSLDQLLTLLAKFELEWKEVIIKNKLKKKCCCLKVASCALHVCHTLPLCE